MGRRSCAHRLCSDVPMRRVRSGNVGATGDRVTDPLPRVLVSKLKFVYSCRCLLLMFRTSPRRAGHRPARLRTFPVFIFQRLYITTVRQQTRGAAFPMVARVPLAACMAQSATTRRLRVPCPLNSCPHSYSVMKPGMLYACPPCPLPAANHNLQKRSI